MVRLKTKPTVQNQRVLLIGVKPWLTALITARFADHDLSVFTLTADEYLHLDQNSLELTSLYKIIWWVNFADLTTQQAVLDNLQTLIEVPLIVLGKLPELFLLDDEKPPQETIASQVFFTSLVGQLVDAQLFFARDLFEVTTLTDCLQFAFRGYSKNLLFDPQSSWYFYKREDFFQALEPYLVRPHSPRRVLIQGKKLISSVVLKKIADLIRRYYNQSLEVIPVIAERLSPPLPEFVKATLQVQIMDELDQFIRHKDQWQIAAKALTPPEDDHWRAVSTQLPGNQDNSNMADSIQVPELADENPLAEQRSRELSQKINIEKRLINRQKIPKEPEEEQKIEGELTRIFYQQRDQKTQQRIGKKVKIVKKVVQKSQKNKALFFGGMTAMVAGGIILVLWGILLFTSFLARNEVLAFFENNSPSNQLHYQPKFWTKTLTTQISFYQSFLSASWLGTSGELAELSEGFIQLNQLQIELNQLAAQYLQSVLNGGETSGVPATTIEEKIIQIQRATGQIVGLAESMLGSSAALENNWLGALQQAQQTQALMAQLPTTLDAILGQEGKRTYAVLLQNNLELRPTGGYIQAIGFFTFDQGLLIDSQFVSPYDLDKRVLASVLAPTEIKRYLGETNWYLRDSNWNPDFPETATRVAWFIRQAVGLQVDGVWAINYLALEDILKAVGPLGLAAYDELLTDKNLLERVEFHSDDELITDQTQRPEYALAVFTQLLRHLQTMPLDQTTSFLEALEVGLTNKQILISLFEPELEEAMERFGWNGKVINPSCPSQFSQVTCLVDQVFQVEANVGLNRVGAYIKREVEHRVDLAGEKIAHTRTVRLENTSRSDGWPLGTYKTYLRFILDNEAQPNSLTVNGRRLTGNQLTVYGEGGKRVVGVPLEIPKQTTTVIEFNYLTEPIPSTSFSYLLFDQQQAGVENTSLKIIVHNPNQKAALLAPNADLFGNTVEFTKVNNNHLFIGVQY
jgi:hypothetical protein